VVGAPMVVMVGHTYVGNGYAVFNRLGELHPGDEVSVSGDGGDVAFRVSDVVFGVPKDRPDALQRVLADHVQHAQLALITSGGEFDRASRASEDNIVVFAIAK
jgi:sortase (surface protein transpeptidase)